MDTRILITGANGQLGRALALKYPKAIALNSDQLDITSQEQVKSFPWKDVDVIINAAAYTNVDGAETAEGRIAAWQVNAVGVANLTKAAMARDIKLIHISTDYVFDGSKDNHQEDEPFSPLNVYGQTKAAGDIAVSLLSNHYVLRTSWVIGEGKNFVRTMLELAKKGINPKVVSDQIGRLTFTSELVRAIDHLLSCNAEPGTYNLSNSGKPASWADITRTMYDLVKLNNTVTDISTEEYYVGKTNVAQRPLNSSLDLTKICSIGFTPTDWEIDLGEYLNKELANKN